MLVRGWRQDSVRCSDNFNHIKVIICGYWYERIRTLLINYSAERKTAKNSKNFLKRLIIDVLWNHSILRMCSIFLGKVDNFNKKI